MRARSHQRRVFTEAVPGREIRHDAAGFERAKSRNGNGKYRRLRILSELEIFFGALKAKLGNRKSQRIIGFFENGARLGKMIE